jgi:hypothetical protein
MILNLVKWGAIGTISAVLILSGISKTLEPTNAVMFVSAMFPILAKLSTAIIYLLSLVEVFLGLMLLFLPEFRPRIFIGVALLFLLFASVAEIFGNGAVDCGCFGAVATQSPDSMMTRNLILIVIAIAGFHASGIGSKDRSSEQAKPL